MKIAQILSTVPGALPKEYAEKLSSLQFDVLQWDGYLLKGE